jgi:DNA-binding winged helix-turn-helix (wHTH) protein
MLFHFGSFQLEVDERRLTRAGEVIPLRSKVFDTLCILVENHGSLVRKDELMQRLWPDSIVEENNLDHNISKLRQALADGNNGQKFIETVPRQGYRFSAEVWAHDGETRSKAQLASVDEPPPETKQDIRFFTAHDGAHIAHSVAGQGPVLVKAANWLNHLEFELKSPVWRHYLPVLTQHHTLIRYDERGNGLSSWNISDFSFESWLRDFEQLIDELQLKRFSLLGISQGAAVAV